MSDDKNISRLISDSLHHKLDEAESRKVAEHLAKDENSQEFAKLSRLIQDSVGYGARQAESSSADGAAESAGLSKQAKTRMSASVAEAAIEKQKLSTAGLIRSSVTSESVFPCLLYTSPSPRDKRQSRMPSSA